MAIHLIPEISINGAGGTYGNPFFGGYIYDVNYNVQVGSDGASTVSVSLVSETGNYTFDQSDLQVTSSYNIILGPISLQMYPTKVRKKYSSRGNLLELEFSDGSLILDKNFVGLHKKHGWNYLMGNPNPPPPTWDNPDCFTIVGREFHPCDVNYDGQIDLIPDIEDVCHPCQQDQNQQDEARLVDCLNLNRYNIFEVKYNFTELISQLTAKGFVFQNGVDPNPQYFNNHVGTIREVLSAWCHNFGWIFFWDNGVIKFKDLRTVPIVNATIQDFCPDIEDFEEEYTLSGTFDKMILTNFTRTGVDKDFECLDAIYITMPPYNQFDAPNPNLKIDSTIDYDASGLVYYGKELRDLYYLYIKYGLTTVSSYQVGKKLPELGLTILTPATYIADVQGPGGVPLGIIEQSTSLSTPQYSPSRNTFNDSVPTDVSFLDLDDVGDLENVRNAIIANEPFFECFQLLDVETQWRVAAKIEHYFFFVGHYDDKTDSVQTEIEKEFASDFIGRYHVYAPDSGGFFEDFTFYNDTVCTTTLKNDNRVKYNFLGDTRGDQLTYYNNVGVNADGDRQTLSALPFAKFLQVINGNQPLGGGGDPLISFKLILVSKGGQKFYPSNVDTTFDPNSGNSWLIQDSKLKNQLHTYYPKILPYNVSSGDQSTSAEGENIVRLLLGQAGTDITNVDSNKVHLMLGYIPGQNEPFVYTRQGGFNNNLVQAPVYFNGDPLNLVIDPITHLPEETIVYRYPQFLCLLLGELDSGECEQGKFLTPIGQFEFFFPSTSDYACILQKTRLVLKRINKYESVEVTGNCNSGNTLALTVDTIDITDADITRFKRLADNTCVWNDDTIADLHNFYSQNLGLSQSTPLLKRTFTVAGISNTTLGIDDGLQSISVTANEQGVSSTYVFGTTHFLLPDDPFAYDYVQHNLNYSQLSAGNTISSVLAPQLSALTP